MKLHHRHRWVYTYHWSEFISTHEASEHGALPPPSLWGQNHKYLFAMPHNPIITRVLYINDDIYNIIRPHDDDQHRLTWANSSYTGQLILCVNYRTFASLQHCRELFHTVKYLTNSRVFQTYFYKGIGCGKSLLHMASWLYASLQNNNCHMHHNNLSSIMLLTIKKIMTCSSTPTPSFFPCIIT